MCAVDGLSLAEREAAVLAALHEASYELAAGSRTIVPRIQVEPASQRVCPVCSNMGERGHILAVFNGERNKVFEAGCLCTVCKSTWDEFYNARIRSQAFNAALSAAGQALGGLGKFIGQAFNVVKSAFSNLGAGKSLLSGLGIRLPSFDTEGRVTKTGLAKVDEGEVIVKESRLGGGFTFAPQIFGSDRAQIRQQVIDQLDTMLDRMGA